MSNAKFEPVISFYIDTDAYTDRDRLMFVCGVEFHMVTTLLRDGWCGCRPIHPENESRTRMAAHKLGRRVEIESDKEYPEWSHLTAYPASGDAE